MKKNRLIPYLLALATIVLPMASMAAPAQPVIAKYFLNIDAPYYYTSVKINNKVVYQGGQASGEEKKLFTNNVKFPADLMKMAGDTIFPIMKQGKNTLTVDYHRINTMGSGVPPLVAITLTNPVQLTQPPIIALVTTKTKGHFQTTFTVPNSFKSPKLLGKQTVLVIPHVPISCSYNVKINQDSEFKTVTVDSLGYMVSLKPKTQNNLNVDYDCPKGKQAVFTIYAKGFSKSITTKKTKGRYSTVIPFQS